MLAAIQFLRALAAWIVVCHHTVQLSSGVLPHGAIVDLFAQYGALGVDLFFVISGFVIHISCAKKSITPGEFLLHRIARVGPAYWAFTTITAILLLCDPSLVMGTKLAPAFFLKSLLFVPAFNPSGLGIYPLLTVGWTLNFEMMFYLIYGLALFAPSRFRLAAIVLGIFALQRVLPKLGGDFSFYDNQIVFEFFIGVMAAEVYARGWTQRMNIWLAFILVAFSVTTIAIHGGIHDWFHVGTSCAAILLAVVSQERYFSGRSFMSCLGNWSYSTYLSHVLIICAAYRMSQTWQIPVYVTLPTGMLIIVAISWLSFAVIEQRASEFLKTVLSTPLRERRSGQA